MLPIWGQLPPELRNIVRRQTNRVTWRRMNSLEGSARRQTKGRVEPMLERVADLLPRFGSLQPLVVRLPDEEITVSNGGNGKYIVKSSVRTNPFLAMTQTDVLTALAPTIRRVVEQNLPITIDILCHQQTVFSYISHVAVLDPAFSVYMNDLRAPLGPREAFLARFSLLVDRLTIVGPPWGVATEEWSVMCYVGANPIWTKGNLRGIWEDEVKGADGQYKEGMTLTLYIERPLGDWTIQTTIAKFQPPSYNLMGSYRNLL